MPDILSGALSDGGLLLFSFAGLLATAVAIVRDTRAQRTDLAEVRFES
ncbi:MAG TPA: hypothetical protein VFM93_08770 [Candidatus Limnocylindria bacterium]|nr:hypothetical protein [Candidatus Limnocylindria bacterium]